MNDYLGSKTNPCKNVEEVSKAIKGKRNCIVYTSRTFELNKMILWEIRLRNIKLCGVNYMFYA